MSERGEAIEDAVGRLALNTLSLLGEVLEKAPAAAQQSLKSFEQRVVSAKMIGQFAIAMGKQEAEKHAKTAVEAATAAGLPLLQSLKSLIANNCDVGQENESTVASAAPKTATSATAKKVKRADSSTQTTSTSPAAAPTSAIDAVIPHYDTLSASNILTLLESLARFELEAVKIHEENARARKTILTRVDQLLAQ